MIFPSCSLVITTVLMHHVEVEWKLRKNATSYFEQILEAAPHKTAVRLLSSHLKNHPRRTRDLEHCWGSKDELISNIFQWNPPHGRANFG